MIVGTMKNDSDDGNDNNSDSDYSDNNFQYQVECLQYVRWKKNGREEEDQCRVDSSVIIITIIIIIDIFRTIALIQRQVKIISRIMLMIRYAANNWRSGDPTKSTQGQWNHGGAFFIMIMLCKITMAMMRMAVIM